jgi:hypothetical protein
MKRILLSCNVSHDTEKYNNHRYIFLSKDEGRLDPVHCLDWIGCWMLDVGCWMLDVKKLKLLFIE